METMHVVLQSLIVGLLSAEGPGNGSPLWTLRIQTSTLTTPALRPQMLLLVSTPYTLWYNPRELSQDLLLPKSCGDYVC